MKTVVKRKDRLPCDRFCFKKKKEELTDMPIILALALSAFGAENSLVSGPVETVRGGHQFTEGPLYLPGGPLLFSDIPADTIFRANGTLFRMPSGQSNGLTLDREGRLIACEHKNRRVTRTEQDGAVTVLAERYQGKRLNSPNDAIVRSDGVLYFTDPPYGLSGGLKDPEAELGFCGVYKIDVAGKLSLLVDDFVTPNGLALSPDEKTLYIADTQNKHVRAFDVVPDGTVSNSRIFCELPGPDGMKIDRDGRIWCTASDGVRVYDASGKLLETVAFPEVPSNCAFGDEDGHTLYVTARKGVYKVRTVSEGIRPMGSSK